MVTLSMTTRVTPQQRKAAEKKAAAGAEKPKLR